MFAPTVFLSAAPMLAAADAATSAPDAAFTGNVLLVLILVVGQVVSLIIAGIGLYISSRRTPPIAEELYKLFQTKEEATQTIERIDHAIESAFTEINAVRTQLSKAFGDVERAMGRVEGALNARHRPPHGHG